MKRRDPSRDIALAALGETWSPAAIEGALADLFASEQRWMRAMARRMTRRFGEAPPLDVLEAFVRADRDLRQARRLLVRHPSLAMPPMPPSRFGAPPIASMGDLATLLEVPVEDLDWLADRRGTTRDAEAPVRHYRARWIPKRSVGWRLVEAPKARLRRAQRCLLDRVLASVPPHEAAHGFVPGRSVLDHARAHVRQAVVVRLDLEDFFASVPAAQVRAVFRTAGYGEDVAVALTALSTTRTPPALLRSPWVSRFETRQRLAHRHLPQGAPTSPWIANLAAYRLDLRVSALARSLGATYTRYADDLVLSGDEGFARGVERLLPRLGAIAIEEGFALQHRKTRVTRAGASQRVCGLVVNEGARVSRRERERLEAILFNCVKHGPASQNRGDHPRFRDHLLGRIAWVEQAHEPHAARLHALFARIEWP
ncbi:MAG: RNA-directed DNA polymerase [Myxococcales bacterium]|nr:RNA-directed DNA polymerase [Myxococcales bacterium]